MRLPVAMTTCALLLSTALAGCAGSSAQPAPGGDATTPASAGAPGDGGMKMGGAPTCPPPAAEGKPERVVTMDAGAAAFLIELGQEKQIVGTAGPDFKNAYEGDLRTKLDKIKVIDPGQGNREKVLEAKPDLVTGISIYEFGAFDGTPTVAQLAENNARVVVACDQPTGQQVTGIQSTYDYVDELGRVFGIPDEATKLNDELKSQLPTPKKDDVRLLALSSAPSGGQGVKTQGGTGVANGIFNLAGTQNIAGDVMSDFADLSSEEVSAKDPQIIVAVTGFGPKSEQELIDSLKESPVLANTTAVKENRIVAVPQSILLSPSVLNPKAAKTIADAAAK